jgi:hypothetical protein
VLQPLAYAHARIGDLDGALKTLAAMNAPGLGKFARKTAIEQIVETLLERGDLAGARRTVDVIPDAESMLHSKEDLLEKIAKRQAEMGDAAGAVAWAGQMPAPGAKLQALRGMADGVVLHVAAGKSKNQ